MSVGLLGVCLEAVSSLGSDPEQHLHAFVAACPVEAEAERVFVSEVVTGCVRYQRPLQVVLKGYYAQETCLRSDTSLYTVVGYLVIFRLEELGVGQLCRLASAPQHRAKVHKFLSFLFAEHNLNGWIRDEWCRLYEEGFVQATLLEPLHRQTAAMLECIAALSSSQTEPKLRSQPVTQPQPFKLTAPTVRLPPTPQLIPSVQPHKPVPKSTYLRPAEEGRLQAAFQANKSRAETVLQQAERLQPACFQTEPSSMSRQRREEILSEREAKLQHTPVKAAAVPQLMKQSRAVRLNTVAILREGARVQREEEVETQRLVGLEAGQTDGSDYLKWQEEVKQREAAEQLVEVKRKHLEGQLSYEEAIIAKQQHGKEMRDRVVLSKKETELMMSQYLSGREEEQREMRRLVEATMSGHQQTREARQRLQALKRRMVQEAILERRELVSAALEQAEEEWRHKVELIQQIRALESVPVLRVKHADLTETSGQGLLTEMSVAELRERLALMKLAEEEERERRKMEIAQKKKAKEERLSGTVESISRHREERSRQASARDQQKAVFNRHQRELHDKKLSSLEDKLESKRRERERLKQAAAQMQPQSQSSSKQELDSPVTTLLRSSNTAVR